MSDTYYITGVHTLSPYDYDELMNRLGKNVRHPRNDDEDRWSIIYVNGSHISRKWWWVPECETDDEDHEVRTGLTVIRHSSSIPRITARVKLAELRAE